MNKLIILLMSVSALSLAACGDQTAQNTPPATPPASTDASKTATAVPAKPADTAAPAADPAKPADTKMAAGDATKPADPAAPAADATTPAAPMVALDPQIQTMIDGLKAKAVSMTPEQKTKSVADVRTAAEGMAKTAGKSDADIKAMGDAAEAAAKTALGV